MKSVSIFVFLFLCLCSCTEKTPAHSSQDSFPVVNGAVNSDTLKSVVDQKGIEQEDTIIRNATGKKELYFQPYRYNLTGTLTTETFYGPPNYGDDPAHDSKELFYMLTLNQGVDVLVHPGDEDKPIHDFDTPTTGIKKLQVAFIGNDSLLLPYINKTITFTGELFGAVNAHHHTTVLFAASAIVK